MPKHNPTLLNKADIDLNNEDFQGLMSEVLEHNANLKFRANGSSMFPFIQDGDTLTISPLTRIKPRIGRVVAFSHPQTKKLIIHRIVGKDGSAYLIKADNSTDQADGLIPLSHILGCVSKVERDGHRIRFGLGLEGRMIAVLSKYSFLTRIMRRLRKLL
jgi:hypothetical protein